jgi:TolB-like protein/Tfp pilus assembly protein PilF
MEMSLNTWSDSDQKAVLEQLDRILKSGPFQQSRRRQRFLEYLVKETLAGRGERLKAYNVAVEVFDRPETFDPIVDPVVRIEAGRLRDKLREFYEAHGRSDPIRIELPKGTYAPSIEFRQASALELGPGAADARTPEHRLELAPAAVAPMNGQQVENVSAPTHVEARPNSPRSALAKIGWAPLGTAAAALLLIIAASFSWMQGRNAGPSLPDKPSIAVLPFDNIGDDPKWERFADGITEDIITDLSHSKDLIVIARNSTEVYKGKPADIRQVGRDLSVKYVLEGSIQSLGERLRVTAQLIEAGSGGHVWSERYDRPVDDLFAVQNDVTQRIAATIAGAEGAVAEAERSLLRRKPPASLTAFDTYLLGMEAKHKVTKEGLNEAEALFRRAIELDPKLARAYYGLATVEMYRIDLGLAPSVEEAMAKMMAAAEKSVELDPNDGNTHLALGGAYAYRGKVEQSLAEYARAEALSPSDADLLLVIAWTLPGAGQSPRAMSLAEKALTLNPHYPGWYNQGLSLVFFFGEQYDRSLQYRLLVKEPLALDYAFLAMAYAYLGRTAEAKTAAANLATADPAWTAERYLSEAGGYAEREAELLVGGARKAGLSDCVPADKLKDMPNLIRIKSCDQQRAKTSG